MTRARSPLRSNGRARPSWSLDFLEHRQHRRVAVALAQAHAAVVALDLDDRAQRIRLVDSAGIEQRRIPASHWARQPARRTFMHLAPRGCGAWNAGGEMEVAFNMKALGTKSQQLSSTSRRMPAAERDEANPARNSRGRRQEPIRHSASARSRNLPNLITLVRRRPRFPLTAWYAASGAYAIAVPIFLLAALSDLADGYIARRFKPPRTGSTLAPGCRRCSCSSWPLS